MLRDIAPDISPVLETLLLSVILQGLGHFLESGKPRKGILVLEDTNRSKWSNCCLPVSTSVLVMVPVNQMFAVYLGDAHVCFIPLHCIAPPQS